MYAAQIWAKAFQKCWKKLLLGYKKRRIVIFLLSSSRYRGESWFRLNPDSAFIWHSLYISWSEAQKCQFGCTRNLKHEKNNATWIFMSLTRSRIPFTAYVWPKRRNTKRSVQAPIHWRSVPDNSFLFTAFLISFLFFCPHTHLSEQGKQANYPSRRISPPPNFEKLHVHLYSGQFVFPCYSTA